MRIVFFKIVALGITVQGLLAALLAAVISSILGPFSFFNGRISTLILALGFSVLSGAIRGLPASLLYATVITQVIRRTNWQGQAWSWLSAGAIGGGLLDAGIALLFSADSTAIVLYAVKGGVCGAVAGLYGWRIAQDQPNGPIPQ